MLLFTLLASMATIMYITIINVNLKIQKLSLENQVADMSTAIQIQNSKIKELGETTKAYQETYLNKQKKAAVIAQETNEILKGISTIPLNKDCSTGLQVGLEYIQSYIKEKGDSDEE